MLVSLSVAVLSQRDQQQGRCKANGRYDTLASLARREGLATAEPTRRLQLIPCQLGEQSIAIIDRDIQSNMQLVLGRFTDRRLEPNRISLRNKVVSRHHAVIYTQAGTLYIRDTSSSAGTFINHCRLSPPNKVSKPYRLMQGDIIQLGTDFHLRLEGLYEAVKLRVVLNEPPPPPPLVQDVSTKETIQEESEETCCICLYPITAMQALFVGPCQHAFHYKCSRPLLCHYPNFQCPLCRKVADLEASVVVSGDHINSNCNDISGDGEDPQRRRASKNDSSSSTNVSNNGRSGGDRRVSSTKIAAMQE
ncbi:SMAD/FHA domain-containing protein [Syncephalastrum racemosum]|uniref:SMAD/FHA domain-containing protein n=1 Tax=Syncephalastrum racemosum TaxID=13706 RepID=A0A1X2HUM3_SYNRA|nr:SMAD/FHA domain-containing protein [Syncephalastrum racemosum]